MDKVSIIVPVYNTERYLRRCFNSVLNQSYKNIELIIVDDGSTDGSEKIIKEYCSKNANIKFLKQENSKQGAARNNGIKNSSGKYILFLDSDDFLPINSIKILVNIIEDSDFAVGNMIVCNENIKEKIEQNTIFEEEKYERVKYIDDILSKARCLKLNNMKYLNECGFLSNSCHKLFKKEFLIKNKIFFPERMVWEDGPFNLQAWFSSKKVYYCNEVVYCRTVRDDINNKSTIQTINMSSIKDDIKSHNITFELCKKFNRMDLIPDRLINFYLVNIKKLKHLNSNEIKYKKDILKQIDLLTKQWVKEVNEENKLDAIKIKYSVGKIKLKYLYNK